MHPTHVGKSKKNSEHQHSSSQTKSKTKAQPQSSSIQRKYEDAKNALLAFSLTVASAGIARIRQNLAERTD
jgi:hypothetical protein